MSSHVRSFRILKRAPIEEPYLSNPIWRRKFFFVKAANGLYFLIILVTYWCSLPVQVFNWLKSRCASTSKFTDNITVKAFEDLGYEDYDEWILRKSVSSMEIQLEGSKGKTINLSNLLSRITSPRYGGPRPRDLINSHNNFHIRERLLPLTVLVRIIEVSLPESTGRNIITKAFKEAFETLHFIDKHIYSTSTKDREVAKKVWMASDFRRLLPNTLRGYDQFTPPPMDHAFLVIEYLYKMMDKDEIGREVLSIKELVMLRSYSSAEELCYFMEDLFVDLLDPMLAQLPQAILKAVTESPEDEFETRVQQSLEHLCKFQSWEGIDRWVVPKGFENCPGLINPEVPSPQHSGEEHDQGYILTQVPHLVVV